MQFKEFDLHLKRYDPYIREAQKRLSQWSIPPELQPYWQEITGRRQPWLVLLPLTMLALAEATDGITAAHETILPAFLLAMELTAIVDDTIDGSMRRSEQTSWPAAYGIASVAPLAVAITALIGQHIPNPAMQNRFFEYLQEVTALELYEAHHRYPQGDDIERLLSVRYRQAAVACRLTLTLAFSQDIAELDTIALLFAEIQQDVDDLVNLVEDRGLQGEGDDFRSGLPTRAMVLALEDNPALAQEIERVWDGVCSGKDVDDLLIRAALLAQVPSVKYAITVNARKLCDLAPVMGAVVEAFMRRI